MLLTIKVLQSCFKTKLVENICVPRFSLQCKITAHLKSYLQCPSSRIEKARFSYVIGDPSLGSRFLYNL